MLECIEEIEGRQTRLEGHDIWQDELVWWMAKAICLLLKEAAIADRDDVRAPSKPEVNSSGRADAQRGARMEGEEKSDLISRQAVLSGIGDSIAYEPSWNHSGLRIAKGIVESLPPAEKVWKWIPVSERLPEEGWCLCTVHGVFYDYCEILSCRKRKRKMRFLRLDDNGEYDDLTNWVVAWMPLPKPWKGENDETD